MNEAIADVGTTTCDVELHVDGIRERRLPSGRSVFLKLAATGEELQIRSPEGEVEVRITLGAGAPVVHLRGARLELETLDTIALRCRELEVDTEKSIRLKSAGNLQVAGQEVRVRTTGDIHLNADVIRLNCPGDPGTDRTQ